MAKNDSRLRILDSDTGEVFSEFEQVWIPRKARIKEGWFMAMQDGFKDLATMPLRGESLRVLLYLMGRLDYENFIRQSQKEICDALGMKKQNVSRAVRDLREHLVIEEDAEKLLKLGTFFGWRGKVSNLNRVHREHHRSRLNGGEQPTPGVAT